MSRRRFFIPRHLISGHFAELPPEQAHHLRDVLRIKPGEQVEVLDGEGNAYSGIVEIDRSTVRIGSLNALQKRVELRLGLTLALPLIKPQRLEWILEKGTELGVEEFVLLKTRYCRDRFTDERVAGRMARWNRIIQEACKQSGRSTAPPIRQPADFAAFIGAAFPAAARFILHPGSGDAWDGRFPECERVIVCVGPEGGWAPDEVEAAAEAGWTVVSMGPQILRAETAVIAALAIFQFQLSKRV